MALGASQTQHSHPSSSRECRFIKINGNFLGKKGLFPSPGGTGMAQRLPHGIPGSHLGCGALGSSQIQGNTKSLPTAIRDWKFLSEMGFFWVKTPFFPNFPRSRGIPSSHLGSGDEGEALGSSQIQGKTQSHPSTIRDRNSTIKSAKLRP